MIRKNHLKHTTKAGAVCNAGKSGAQLQGRENIVVRFAEFVASPAAQCERCRASKLFAFLQRAAA